jgi:hypothetical protein
MRYLAAGEIVHINHRLLGSETPLDFGLLESAAGLPQQSAFGVDAYPDMHLKPPLCSGRLSATTLSWTGTSGRLWQRSTSSMG